MRSQIIGLINQDCLGGLASFTLNQVAFSLRPTYCIGIAAVDLLDFLGQDLSVIIFFSVLRSLDVDSTESAHKHTDQVQLHTEID